MGVFLSCLPCSAPQTRLIPWFRAMHWDIWVHFSVLSQTSYVTFGTPLNLGRLRAIVGRALNWESDLESVPASATDQLHDLRHVTSPLGASVFPCCPLSILSKL